MKEADLKDKFIQAIQVYPFFEKQFLEASE